MASLLLCVGALLLAWAASVNVAVVGAAAADVRLTSGAENIEANFPAQTAAAADALAASAAASGYPSRSLVPLRATVTPEAATLMSQAVTAFKASEKSFDVRFDNAVSSPELKTKYFNEGAHRTTATSNNASKPGRKGSLCIILSTGTVGSVFSLPSPLCVWSAGLLVFSLFLPLSLPPSLSSSFLQVAWTSP
jgi:hypothetical protein